MPVSTFDAHELSPGDSFLIKSPSKDDENLVKSVVYAGENLILYDKFYEKIRFDPVNDDSIITLLELAFNYSYLSSKQLEFPNIEPEITQKDYETRIHAWKSRIETLIKNILLPRKIVSKVFIPLRPSLIEVNTPIYRKFDPAKNPLQPKNFLRMISKFFSDQRVDISEILPVQIPKRDTVMLLHHMTVDRQWQSQSIPPEPNYLLYENFEDYEHAYLNWYEITHGSVSIQDARDFKNNIKVEFANHQTIGKIEKETQEKSQPDLIYSYDWVKGLKKPNDSINLDLFYEPTNPPEKENILAENMVFGVDKDEFLNQMIYFGEYQPKIKSNGPQHAFKVLHYPIKSYDQEELQNVINTNPFKIFNYCIDEKQLSSLLEATTNNTSPIVKLINSFNHIELNQYLDIADNSSCHAYRISYFFKLMMKYPKIRLFMLNIFKNPDNIDFLYRFVRIFLVLCHENIRLHKRPENCSHFSISVEQVHLLSILINLQLSPPFTEFDCELHRLCRVELANIASFLQNPIICVGLMKSLKNDVYSPTSFDICTLSSIPSDQILNLLLKDQILETVIEASEYKIGRYFLNSIMYMISGWFAHNFILQSRNFKQNVIFKISATASQFISIILNQYGRYVCQGNCPPQLDHINDILQVILHGYSKRFLPIINSIIRLMNQIKLTDSDSYYEGLAGSFLGQICVQALCGSNINVEECFEILMQCTNFPNFSSQILFNGEFVHLLLDNLITGTRKSMAAAWKIFNAAEKNKNAVISTFSLPDCQIKFQKMAETQNPFVFRKFCKFIMTLTRIGGFGLLDKFLPLIAPKMGSFACTIKNSYLIFGNSKAVRVMQQMLTKLFSSEIKSDFRSNLKHHLESLKFEMNKYKKL